MAPRRRVKDNSKDKHATTTKLQHRDNAIESSRKTELNMESRKEVIAMHLPPLPLVMTVLICSGFMWMFAFRDMMATGKSLIAPIDNAFLAFTKSNYWFDDSHGWKSSAGGISAVESITTDSNKMGDFFVRKLAGAAGLGFYTQKLLPFLSHPVDTQWGNGHFVPLLFTSVLANLAVVGFYLFYFEDLRDAGAGLFAIVMVTILSVETVAMVYYLLSTHNLHTKAMITIKHKHKHPNSITSRIVMRTVSIVSGMVTIISVRDLFFPGQIISFIPRDDIYLEWTGAFIHSPPTGTPEEEEHSMESPLHIGDKFVSQLAALYMLILCLYKFATAFFIRYGKDASGEIKCRMIWKVQAISGCLVVFILRIFASASLSASLDLRWHLMCLAYETFILGLNGYW